MVVVFSVSGNAPHQLERLPLGILPLGWTPDGMGLLVSRSLGDEGVLVELWTRGGRP